MNIICDLDGVLADFVSATRKVHGHPEGVVDKWNYFEDWGLSEKEFWEGIIKRGEKFYGEDVLPYPWAMELITMLQKYGDIFVMTSPHNHPTGYSGKKIWCDKYIPDVPLIVGSDKHLLSREGTVLLDDSDSNYDKFESLGKGRAILFPQPWNKGKALLDLYDYDRLRVIEGCLLTFRSMEVVYA